MSLFHQIADVKNEFKQLTVTSDGSTSISIATLQGWVEQTEATVIGIISKKYILPIDSALNPLSFLIVQRICIGLSAGRVIRALRRNGLERENPDEKTRFESLMSESRSDLKKIATNEIILPDANRIQLLQNNIGYDKTKRTEPIFEKYRRQW